MCFVKLALEADTSKTESQQRGAPYRHIAIGHSLFLDCIGVFGAIDKQLITETENKCKLTSDQVQFLYHICAKKFQKTEKHVRGHLRTQFTARKKKSFNDNFCKKNNSIKIPIKD